MYMFLISCLLVLSSGASVERRANGDVGCLYNGVFEYVGSKFASLNGCNTCTCTRNGVQCTPTGCSVRPTAGVILSGACVYPATSQLYQNGQTFAATDGCNTCTCSSGRVTCTTRTCTRVTVGNSCVYTATGQSYITGQTFAAVDGCNTCTCTNGYITCTTRTCPGLVTPGINIGINVHPGGGVHTGSTCYDNNQHRFHNDGDSYTALDGCNVCTCSTGLLTCTKRVCNGGTIGQTCVDLASLQTYYNGQRFRSSDGCNTCECRNGQIVCTKLPCPAIG